MLALVPALAMAASPASVGSPVRGERIAQRYCAPCHAVGTAGESPTGPAPAFRDLHTRYPVADLINAIGQGARTAHPEMPQFRLKIGQVHDLTAYVLSVQRPAPPRSGP
jgi:mono/diheme cytochrome c family protein